MGFRPHLKIGLVALSVLTAAATFSVGGRVAWAAATLIDVFQDWSAFKDTEKGKLVCTAGSVAVKSEGKYTSRGDVLIQVTHRQADKTVGVVSIQAGYTYKSGSEVTVTIGGQTFKLFTDAGHAWAFDDKGDKALVAAMKGGADMIVKGTSSRDTLTTDTFSLNGFTAAYTAISQACGIK
ncbi:MAG: invasion associated locus B family protein [Rhodospirillales bacterium]|nr:invasion associated locus B family protein [Rhodospirillales bacterium]